MYISVPWAIALGVAGAMAVVVALGIAARRGVIAAPERALAHVAYLLGGGLTGFMAVAFPPAWPLLAAVMGMTVIRAIQARRILDVGLLTVGFGSAWTLLFGSGVLNVLTDPAIYAPGVAVSFVLAIGILVAGLVVTIVGAAVDAPHRDSPLCRRGRF
jgi:hypothetical protein